jgi:hypothetical protein
MPFRPDPLTNAAHRKVSELRDAATLSGALDKEALEQAEGLLRVIDLRARLSAQRVRWALTCFTVVFAAMLLVLASCPVFTIDVEGSLQSETVGVRLSSAAILPIEESTSTFAAAGPVPVESSDPSHATAKKEPLLLTADGSGRITINQITVPPRALLQFAISHDGTVSLHVRCDSNCDEGRIHLTLAGVVRTGAGSPWPQNGRHVELGLTQGDNDVEFRLRDTAALVRLGAVDADSLTFEHRVTGVEGDREMPMVVSSVIGGELRNMTMGTIQPLSRGDRLKIGDGTFALHYVRVEKGVLSTRFTGEPRELDREGKSLVPSWLEWIWTRGPLKLLWAVFIAFLGTLMAAARWKNPFV